MSFIREKFAYDYNALEPHIDAKTMEIHSEKHHEAYTTKLNAAIENTEWEHYSIEELFGMLTDLPENIKSTVRNNGGGFANHNLYFTTIAPNAGGVPTGALAHALDATFGSFESFKESFTAKATNQFGSGWAFLALDEEGSLYVTSKPNQDSPLMDNHVPILGVDVWEHAYYLQYQNKRADYIAAFWNVINWSAVSELFESNKA